MSALREEADPQPETSVPVGSPLRPDLLLLPAGAPLFRLAGEADDDEGEQHIVRGID